MILCPTILFYPAPTSTPNNPSFSIIHKDLKHPSTSKQQRHPRSMVQEMPIIRAIVDNSPDEPEMVEQRNSEKDRATNSSIDAPSSLRRMKSVPQHRSLEMNMSITSIVRTPKYSHTAPVGDSELNGLSNALKTIGSTRLTKSMPPIRSRPYVFAVFPRSASKKGSTTDASVASYKSNNETGSWLPQGVEFQNRVEVYFYKEYH